MIKSMTGYGKGQAQQEQGGFTVEIRSVNHRYGEISVRMPRAFLSLEQEVRKAVSQRLKRGKIDLFIQWDETAGDTTVSRINREVARAYVREFRGLAEELELSPVIPLELLLSQKGVMGEPASTDEPDDAGRALLHALEGAIDALDAMRRTEGESLVTDLRQRRQAISSQSDRIRERAPLVLEENHQKLKTRLTQLLEGVELDQTRLVQEMALMADRCDITEELVRLASHFKQFDETLLLHEPVGRKLDFLMQEMNREINTIGSKSNDAEIATLVVGIKAEMEKMREQVQNIE